MRISTLDGIFAVQYTTLTAGPFLTAFLLALGASAPQIGLVGALPLVAGLLQPAGAEIIRRRGGRRKGLLLQAALVDAALWSLSMAAVTWLPTPGALIVVLSVLAVQQGATALVGAAWTSWISDVVPSRVRGRYFGRRNFVANAFGAATAVLAGWAVRTGGPEPVPIFLAFFGVGILCRLISIRFLSLQPEPVRAASLGGGFLAQLRGPLADHQYRRYLIFGAAWGFSVWFAAPFFTVYMIREAGLSVQMVMVLAAISTVSNLMGQRVWGQICDRFGDKQVMSLSGLIVALHPIWWLFTDGHGPGLYVLPVLSVIGGFTWGGFTLATGNLMMRLAPEGGKTAFFAMQAALGGGFGAAGSLIGGVIAGLLVGTAGFYPIWALEGLKSMFLVAAFLRAGAWLLMMRIPDPVARPRLRTVYVIKDTVRSLNPSQGFSPILDAFLPGGERRGGSRRPAKPDGRG